MLVSIASRESCWSITRFGCSTDASKSFSWPVFVTPNRASRRMDVVGLAIGSDAFGRSGFDAKARLMLSSGAIVLSTLGGENT